jgi:hypothetical protein
VCHLQRQRLYLNHCPDFVDHYKGYLRELLTRIDTPAAVADIYPALHNLTLQPPDGTTQADHAVLETKNMKG